jgi:hypothetical protein
MEQPVTSTSAKGLAIGLVLVIISLGIYLLNIDINSPVKWFPLLLFIAGILWSINLYGKQIKHNSGFGNYFSHGFKTSAIVTLIMIAFVIISLFIFPEIKERGIEESRKAMVAQNKLTNEQIESYLATTKKFYAVIAIGFTLFLYMSLGALSSLVGAAITKKEPGKFVEDNNQINQ